MSNHVEVLVFLFHRDPTCAVKKRTLSLYLSQVTHPASAYPSFHSMKWPGVKLSLDPPWMGCQSYARLPLIISSGFPDNLPYPFILLGGRRLCESKMFVQEHNTMTRPGLEPRPFNLESSALIIWPLCLLKVRWGEEEIVSNLTPTPLLDPSPFISKNYSRYLKTIVGWLSHNNLCYSNKS